MRVAVTGTPGTGKTTATERLFAGTSESDAAVDHPPVSDLDVVHLNDLIESEGLYTHVDEERDSLVADMEAIDGWLDDWDGDRFDDRDDVVIDSHLAHHLPVDRVVVLRCHPADLEQRLLDRGESPEKARENAESEALDVILAEAVERHGPDRVYEIDTTDRSPAEVVDEIAAAIADERDPSAGTVDFLEYLTTDGHHGGQP